MDDIDKLVTHFPRARRAELRETFEGLAPESREALAARLAVNPGSALADATLAERAEIIADLAARRVFDLHTRHIATRPLRGADATAAQHEHAALVAEVHEVRAAALDAIERDAGEKLRAAQRRWGSDPQRLASVRERVALATKSGGPAVLDVLYQLQEAGEVFTAPALRDIMNSIDPLAESTTPQERSARRVLEQALPEFEGPDVADARAALAEVEQARRGKHSAPGVDYGKR